MDTKKQETDVMTAEPAAGTTMGGAHGLSFSELKGGRRQNKSKHNKSKRRGGNNSKHNNSKHNNSKRRHQNKSKRRHQRGGK